MRIKTIQWQMLEENTPKTFLALRAELPFDCYATIYPKRGSSELYLNIWGGGDDNDLSYNFKRKLYSNIEEAKEAAQQFVDNELNKWIE